METKATGISLMRNESFFFDDEREKYPSSEKLRLEIAKMHNTSPSNVILGAGIKGVFQTVCIGLTNLGIYEIQSSDNLYLGALSTMRNLKIKKVKESSLARLAINPSNPLGTFTYFDDNKAINIYDEAYIEYCDEESSVKDTFMDNTIVMRTLSKAYGLASIRVGYAIVSSNIADHFRGIEGEYNISSNSCAEAINGIRNKKGLRNSISENKKSRLFLTSSLIELGYKVKVSVANFVVANVPEIEKYQVRDLSQYGIGDKRITTHNLSIMSDYINELRKIK